MKSRRIALVGLGLLATLATGCADKAETRRQAELRVLQLGTPQSDRDTVAKALLEARLALDAVSESETEHGVLSERAGRLAEQAGISMPSDPDAIVPALAESDRFDAQGRFQGESMALHGLCTATHLGAENAWTAYESGWF